MAVHEGDSQDTRGNNGAALPAGQSAKSAHDLRDDASPKRDYAQELTETIAAALKQRSRSEPTIVGGIRQRAELYEKAFVHAKQGVIDSVIKDVAVTERQARQDQLLRQADVEVLPPEMVGTLAALDARQYAKLRDPQRRAEAALAMATTARVSAGYHAALAAKAPEVSAAARAVMVASDKMAEVNVGPTPGDRSAVPRDRAASDVLLAPTMSLDASALERVAANRAQDIQMVAEQLGLNGIELVTRRKHPARHADEPNAAVKPAEERPPQTMRPPSPGDNQVTSDEVFTAAKDDRKPILPVEVEDKYLRVGSKFYHPNNTKLVAFEDKGNKLQTQSNSEQIAEAMVSIARARGWDEIRVAGSETFRREVWLEATAHGMHVKGYSPSDVDRAELAKRSKHTEANQVEADRKTHASTHHADAAQPANAETSATAQTKGTDAIGKRQPTIEDRQRAQAFAEKTAADALMDHPELAGTYAAMTSMEKKAAIDGLDPQQRAVVMARVEANLVNSIERGDLPTVKVREQVEVQLERKSDKKVAR